jgi:WD40 repeat protein
VLEGHEEAVNSAAFSPDSQRAVTASGDSTARLWDHTK